MQEKLLRESRRFGDEEDSDKKGGAMPEKKGQEEERARDAETSEDPGVDEKREEATSIKFAKKDLVTELANRKDKSGDDRTGGFISSRRQNCRAYALRRETLSTSFANEVLNLKVTLFCSTTDTHSERNPQTRGLVQRGHS
jgi:hypothetical protein